VGFPPRRFDEVKETHRVGQNCVTLKFNANHLQKKYDYIIAGMGCAGLSLAYQLAQHPELRQKKVLLIDRDRKDKNDRTWSFWEAGDGIFEEIVCKKWSKLHFKSPDFEKTTDIAPFAYKMIKGIDFYNHVLPVLKAVPNFDIVFENIQQIDNQPNHATLKTVENTYQADYIFNSALRPKIDPESCNYILQHFKGWEIETAEDTFDTSVATFMDFDVNQKGEVRFFYVLPTSKRKALVEIAIFSNNILEDAEYEKLVGDYIHNQLKISNFKTLHKEFGIIPMTDYSFENPLGKRVVSMGTAGGQVKPSTGYAFSRIQKNVATVFNNLVNGNHPAEKLEGKARFHFYDRVFLNVFLNNRVSAPEVFTSLFKSNPTTRILKFLSEETSLKEELFIVNAPPKWAFMRAFFDEYF
jgi:lycopene beta-cyclase